MENTKKVTTIDVADLPEKAKKASADFKETATNLKDAANIIAESQIPVTEILIGAAVGVVATLTALACRSSGNGD